MDISQEPLETSDGGPESLDGLWHGDDEHGQQKNNIILFSGDLFYCFGFLRQGPTMLPWLIGACYIDQAGPESAWFLDFLNAGITSIFHQHFALCFILIQSPRFTAQKSHDIMILLPHFPSATWKMWATTTNVLKVFQKKNTGMEEQDIGSNREGWLMCDHLKNQCLFR